MGIIVELDVGYIFMADMGSGWQHLDAAGGLGTLPLPLVGAWGFRLVALLGLVARDNL